MIAIQARNQGVCAGVNPPAKFFSPLEKRVGRSSKLLGIV